MAIGCSHGNRANQDALAAVLLFREKFKPDEVIHLGDAYDLAALRSGSLRDQNDSDQADDYLDDIQEGAKFLNELRPTVFTMGNHDERAKKYLNHHNAVVRGFAEAVWERMLKPIEKHCHTFIKYNDGLDRSFYRLGGFKWGYSTVRTSCVIQPRLLVTALWLTLTEQVKQLVELNQIRLAFVLERLRTFLRWITRANDDQL